MYENTEFVLFLMIAGIFVLSKLSSYAEKTRKNQIKEEIIRETIKKVAQKRRLDELYGRNKEE